LSSNHLDHTSSNKHKPIEGSLPPRSTKHSREHESEDDGFEKPKKFPVIQMILFAFIALIAAFLVFYFYQQYNTPLATKPYIDPVESVNQQEDQVDQIDSPKAPKEEVSLEENGEINNTEEQDQDKENTKDNTKDNSQSDKENTEKQNQAIEEPKQAPTLRTLHIIQPGETMFSITMKYFGSSDFIDYVAEFNQISDIREIKSGMELKIPEKP
jgi:cytoskeletal protein RodZ